MNLDQNNHMFVPVYVASSVLPVHALIDTGATGYAFVGARFARKHNFSHYRLPKPVEIRGFDDKLISSITLAAIFPLQIGRHRELLAAFVLDSDKWPIVLGLPWTEKHRLITDHSTQDITFGLPCIEQGHCEFETNIPYYHNVNDLYLQSAKLPNATTTSPVTPRPEIPVAKGKEETLSPLRQATENNQKKQVQHAQLIPRSDVPLRILSRRSHKIQLKPQLKPQPKTPLEPSAPRLDIDISAKMISPASFCFNARQKDAHFFALSMRELDVKIDGECRTQVQAVHVGNASMLIGNSSDPLNVLPQFYHDYLDRFDHTEANKLPAHRPTDHHIELTPNAALPNTRAYPMNVEKLKALRAQLEKDLSRGFIRESRSPVASPVLFVQKKNGDLRFCIDYRKLNDITIKNRYPLPLISETLDRLSKAKYFTKLDIISAFNNLRIKEGDEWKTAFTTRYGLYEYLVMPFGLCNGPSSFQAYINRALQGLLDNFCTAYVDDILIYSNNLREHRRHVRQVLQRLREHDLFIDIAKCSFETHEVQYLGLIIGTDGIRMDPKKIAAVMEWPAPRHLKDVQGFLGFCNFYRRFIPDFAKIAHPLTALTKKDALFKWSDDCKAAFLRIKQRFQDGDILAHFDPSRETILETDSSDYVSGATLSQVVDGVLRPVAFMSKKMLPAECNYEIYDKELLAIVRAFEEWPAELSAVHDPTKVLTDHKGLEYFTSTKNLVRRQVRWNEFLSQFNFKIDFRPGKQGGKPDALTRRSSDKPQSAQDERIQYQQQTLLKPERILRPVVVDPEPEFPNHPSIEVQNESSIDWPEAYANDNETQRVRQALQSNVHHDSTFQLPNCELSEHGFTYNRRRFVPESIRVTLMRRFHDSPLFGHRGSDALYAALSRSFFWPSMVQDTSRYARGCRSCGRNKYSVKKPYGLLQSLPPPELPLRHWTLDFIGPFQPSKYYQQHCRWILVVVDRLTKFNVLIPLPDATALTTAHGFLDHVIRNFGLPESLLSDQGTSFLSEFWQKLCKKAHITHKVTTTYHPQTDGQTERSNRTLEEYLRHFVNYNQDDWAQWLPTAQHALNTAVHTTTSTAPFVAVFGHEPRTLEESHNFEPSTTRNIADKLYNVEAMMRHLQESIRAGTARQAIQYDKHRSPAHAYKAGDLVFVDVRHLPRQRPTPKVDKVRAGPYPILRMKSPLVAVVQLPEGSHVNNQFHVSKLLPCSPDAFLEQQEPQPAPLEIDEDDTPVYEVESILDARRRRNQLQYLVKWVGWDEPTWQHENDVDNAPQAIQDFYAQHPHTPRSQELTS